MKDITQTGFLDDIALTWMEDQRNIGIEKLAFGAVVLVRPVVLGPDSHPETESLVVPPELAVQSWPSCWPGSG